MVIKIRFICKNLKLNSTFLTFLYKYFMMVKYRYQMKNNLKYNRKFTNKTPWIQRVNPYITSKQLMLPVWFTIYIMWHQENKKIILHWNLLRSYMYMYKKLYNTIIYNITTKRDREISANLKHMYVFLILTPHWLNYR